MAQKSNAYRFNWQGSGMGHVWFRAYTPEGNGELEYVSPQHLQPYHRKHYNGTAAEFARDVEAALHVLHWQDSRKPVSPELIQAFNAWRMAEHAEHCAKILAAPERYGVTDSADPLLAPPVVLRGGRYQSGHGWVITAQGEA